MNDGKRNQTAQLGCGTFILIALIVMFFSSGTRDLEREVRELRNEVQRLKQSVDAQSYEIRRLRETPAPPPAKLPKAAE